MVEASPARRRRQLGELLLDEHLVTPDQLNRALEIHRATGERLGRVLLDMGVVDQEHIARVLSQQIGIEFLHLTGQSLREDVLQLLPATLASRLQAVPVAKENGVLTVAMVDPLDVVAIDDIRRHTGFDVKVAVITTRDFQYALNQYPVLDVAQELVRDLPQPQAVDEEISLERLRRMADEQPVVRLVKSAPIYDLDKLGLSAQNYQVLRRIIQRPQGIFLLTGPTGSGKTTTLYAILNQLNNEKVNVLTVEDPVEYQIAGITQMQVNVRAGVTFASSLRHFLRQDPDIIMVGEVRDQETARIAIQAALTGHLVLSTLHTNDAPGAITRLLDMGIEPYLVASALEGVAAQRLVRVLCPKCREADAAGAEELRTRFGGAAPAGTYYLGRGCEFCNYTGYRGRVAIFEIAEMNDELRHLVINRVPHHTLKEAAVAAGMTTLLSDGLAKAAAGVTSLAEVWRVVQVERASDPTDAVGRSSDQAVAEWAVGQSSDQGVAEVTASG